MKIFGGTRSVYFAKEICKNLGVELASSKRRDFSDGEFAHQLLETVRGKNVYLVQSTFMGVDNFFELLQMADCAKRSGAKHVIAVVPYLMFCRSDKKDSPRTPISAALVAKMVEASGINHLITMDLHNRSIEGFYNIPVTHIYSSYVIVPIIKQQNADKKLMAVSPDMGGTKNAKIYSQHLGTDMAICYKHREKANEINEMRLIGTVRDRHILLVDDMADTCGTLRKCADLLIENGALSVKAVIAHPVLSGLAYENLGKSKIEELIITNSIPLASTNEFTDIEMSGLKKITVIDVAPLFANIIRNIEDEKSVSDNFLI